MGEFDGTSRCFKPVHKRLTAYRSPIFAPIPVGNSSDEGTFQRSEKHIT